MNSTYSVHGGGGLHDKIFALTGKGNLYLSELRVKRKDRIITLASGMIVGILVAFIGAYLKSKM
jgi:DNA-binding PadR family transcriptional regulator